MMPLPFAHSQHVALHAVHPSQTQRKVCCRSLTTSTSRQPPDRSGRGAKPSCAPTPELAFNGGQNAGLERSDQPRAMTWKGSLNQKSPVRLRCVARRLILLNHGPLCCNAKRRVNNFVRNLRLWFQRFSAQLELQELSPACPRALEGHRSGPRQVVLESIALDVALSDKVRDVVKKLPNGACCSKRDDNVTWRGKSAEEKFAGLALALEVAPRETTLAVDCRAVAHAWRLPLPKQLAANQVYAGVLLSSYRDLNRPNVKKVQWIKSHRPGPGDLCRRSARDPKERGGRRACKSGSPVPRRRNLEMGEAACQAGENVGDCPDDRSDACIVAQSEACWGAPSGADSFRHF